MLLISEPIQQNEGHNTKSRIKTAYKMNMKFEYYTMPRPILPAGVSIELVIVEPGSVKSDSRNTKEPA